MKEYKLHIFYDHPESVTVIYVETDDIVYWIKSMYECDIYFHMSKNNTIVLNPKKICEIRYDEKKGVMK